MTLRKTIAFISLALLLVLTGPAGGLPNVVQAAPVASLPPGDAFGYQTSPTTRVTPPEDVCLTGTSVFSTDTESFSLPIPIGFDFPFYETTITDLRVSINGLITVITPNADVPAPLPLPSNVVPNGLIAPYWTDLSLLTSGKVCYRTFTDYMAIEWNAVQTTSGIPITFQTLLFPNGNILFQYSDPLPSASGASIGIEDAEGIFGMQFHTDVTGSLPDPATLITYPTNSHAGARFVPAYSSGFLIQHEAFLQITVQNITGVDSAFTLDINDSNPDVCGWAVPAGWQMDISDGSTPLDIINGCPTTSIPLSGEKSLTVHILSPETLDVGDYYPFSLTAFPADLTLLPAGFTPLQVSMDLQVAVPANFAQVYKDPQQAINLSRIWKDASATTRAGALDYYGANLAMVRTNSGNYFLVWEYKTSYSRLKGSFLGADGSNLITDFWITDQMTQNDESPSLTILPDGSTAVVWIRGNKALYLRNYSSSGNATIAETPLEVSSCPRLSAPQVAALSSSKLLVVWECNRVTTDIYMNIVDLANHTNQAVRVAQSSTALEYYNPQIIALDNGTAMISYIRKQKSGIIDPFVFQVVNASGVTVQPESTPPTGAAIPAQKIERDMVGLSSGVVLAGWTNPTTGKVQYMILRGANNTWTQGAVENIDIGFQIGAEKLSITRDPAGNGILTWLEAKKNSTLNYALVGLNTEGNYAVLTPAMAFFTGPNSVTLDTSATGQGNTSYDPRSFLYIPLVER